MFKNLANIGTLLRNAQQFSGKLQEIQDRLRQERVVGSAGAGLIEVEANGLGEVLRLRIDPQLVERKDREMIESLTPAAINQALEKAKKLHAEAMQSLAGGMNIPGLDQAIAQLTGSGDPT